MSAQRFNLSASAAAIGAAVWFGGSGIAFAATEAADAAPPPAPAASVLPEIVVTGERRETKLKEVPASVAAVGTQKLESAGIQNLSDLSSITPSLAISVGQTSFINIRGVGVGVATPFQFAGVPLHMDGMYIPNSALYIKDAYFDVDQVEVYRGPQGTFAGQNSTGGAIFVNAKQPQTDSFAAQIQQTFGSYNWFQTQGYMNLPINDTLAARVSFNSETRDSFFHNLGGSGPNLAGCCSGNDYSVVAGNHPGNVDTHSARVIVRWTPTDRLDVRFRVDYAHDANEGLGFARAAPGSFNNPSKIIDPWTLHLDFAGITRIDTYRPMLNLKYALTDGVALKVVVGAQRIDYLQLYDGDGFTPYLQDPYNPGSFVAQNVQTSKDTTMYYYQEADLVSTGTGRLAWTVGGMHYTESEIFFNHVENYNRNNCATTAVPVCTTSQILSGGNALDYSQAFESYAGFFDGTYALLDNLKLTAGARYTHYVVSLLPGSTARSSAPPFALNTCGTTTPTSGVPNPCNLYGGAFYNNVAGRFAIDWAMTPNFSVYGTVSRGFKPGAFYSQFTLQESHETQVANGETQYKAEVITNYETGVKAVLFDRRLRANLSAFTEDYVDYQAQFIIPGTNIPRAFNIPKSTITGAEFDVEGVLGNFRTALSGSVLNSEIKSDSTIRVPASYYSPGCPAGAPPLPASCVAPLPLTFAAASGAFTTDPKGDPLNYSPKLTVNASMEYDFHIAGGTLTPRVQYAYMDSQWASLFHASSDFIPSHSTIDLRLAYQAAKHWRVEGFATNVENKLYVAGSSSQNLGVVYLGAPRQVGLRLQYTY